MLGLYWLSAISVNRRRGVGMSLLKVMFRACLGANSYSSISVLPSEYLGPLGKPF